MTRKSFFSLLLGLGTALAAQAQATYSNPVIDHDFADPTVTRAADGLFYAYATGPLCARSADLVHWTDVDCGLKMPSWNDTTYVHPSGEKRTDHYSVWALDANFVGGQYLVYYSHAIWLDADNRTVGDGRTGVGVAVGKSPTALIDHGKLFRGEELGVTNSIDPCYVEDNGRKYMVWGSFFGIYMVELTADGLGVKKPVNQVKLAGTAFEGSMIHKRGKYYYYFGSQGSCCEGLNSTYRTVMGRAEKLEGPYLDRDGNRLLDNHFSTLIQSDERWKGTGHNSEVITDDNGDDWILYHSYDAQNPESGRVTLLDRLNWDEDGWPSVNDGTPTDGPTPAPVFRN